MIYSRSAEYAIRAFVYMATVPEGKYAMAKQIAEAGDIPAHFLAKILQQLAKRGHLKSSKGPTGGFALAAPARSISLCQIVEAVDGLTGYKRCLGGNTECNDQAPCGMHDSWKHMRSSIIDYLESTSIEAVSASLEQKRRSLAQLNAPAAAGGPRRANSKK